MTSYHASTSRDLVFLPHAERRRALQDPDAYLSVEKLLRAHFQMCQEVPTKIENTIVAMVDFDRALERAREIDRMIKAGIVLPMYGQFVFVKDTWPTEGFTITGGGIPGVKISDRGNAWIVQQYINAGAIVLGICASPPAAADWQLWHKDPDKRGNCAYNPNYSSDGSTAGANLLPWGCCSLVIGSDMCGSGRGPAKANGVVGFKFSRLAPCHDHVPPIVDRQMPLHMPSPAIIFHHASDALAFVRVVAGKEICTADPVVRMLHEDEGRAWLPESVDQDRVFGLDISMKPLSFTHRENLGTWLSRLRDNATVDSTAVTYDEEPVPGIMAIWGNLFGSDLAPQMPFPVRTIEKIRHWWRASRGGDAVSAAILSGLRASSSERELILNTWKVARNIYENFFTLGEHPLYALVSPVDAYGTAFPHTKPGSQLEVDGKLSSYGRTIGLGRMLPNVAGAPAAAFLIGWREDLGLPEGAQMMMPMGADMRLANELAYLAECGAIPPFRSAFDEQKAVITSTRVC